MKKFLSLLLSFSMVLSMSACGNEKAFEEVEKEANGVTEKLGEDIKVEKLVFDPSNKDEEMDRVSDFAVELFKNSIKEGESSLISPLSVLSALAMTINGCEGETLKEMETVMGMKRDELNNFMVNYLSLLKSSEEYKLYLADSIWFNERGFIPNQDFLCKNAEIYNADIFKSPFDEKTLADINKWVETATDGMIPSILDSVDPDENMMLIINALSFEGEWEHTYEENEVKKLPFFLESGKKTEASYLLGKEFSFIENENCSGFIKPYKGEKYSFAALLPNKDVTLSHFLESLEGRTLRKMLLDPVPVPVDIKLPKFDTSYETSLVNALKAMGAESIFIKDKADLSSLGKTDTNLYVDDVIHKTHLSLGEKGTKAGAATAVLINKMMSCFDSETKEVNLNRPFVYMIFDSETGIPFFIGTMTEPKA